MPAQAKPQWVFELWCLGIGDDRCARDKALPVSPLRRIFWFVRGWLLTALFGWWEWE